ncbi:IclR family transcriptional regulator [Occultella gossypii]|uniref:IclR family transcriptional regulator n=1 Tax=Occultella gossypii TaxID=2800820 RepID=A0ABS7SH60_9MICO|nr:IclR family transcriptional regulator [Occultella gossypii]MBZ2199697.1 IclR family transcriptional regulator [Occultella gossypii]
MTVAHPGPEQASASALAKGLRVLEAVLTNHRLTDICATTGLSYGTAHRILAELVAGGWVVQDADRRYHPGPRQDGMVSLRRPAGGTGGGLDPARCDLTPHLLRLREATGLTVHLAAVRDAGLVYVAKVEAPGSYLLGSYVGLELDLHATAIGKAYLATMAPERAVRILAERPVHARTRHTLVSRARLLVDLSQTRERGWAFDNGENEEGIRCIGVALRGPDGEVCGGLSVSGPDAALERPTIAAQALAVVRAGTAIGIALTSSGADTAGAPD